MSVDLSDEDIYPAYDSVLSGQANNWLLLKYSTRDKLFLCGNGSKNIEEIKNLLSDDQIYFGFLRVQENKEGTGTHVLFSYIPEGTSGVRRARALVHGRAVASLFKAHQAMMIFSKASQLTIKNICAKLEELDKVPVVPRSSLSSTESSMVSSSIPPTSSSPSETTRSSYRVLHERAPSRPSPRVPTPHLSSDDDVPPPTPPKTIYTAPTSFHQRKISDTAISLAKRSSTAEAMHRSNTSRSQSDFLHNPSLHQMQPVQPVRRTELSVITLDEDPAVQERVRLEIRRLREQAEREMAEAEAEANSVVRVVKKNGIQEDLYEERRRKAEEEKEKQRRIAQRLLREQARKEQEEKEEQERAQRRTEDKERRIHAARLAQQKRDEAERNIAIQQLRESEMLELKKAASKAHLARIQTHFLNVYGPEEVLLSGYISIQPGDAITWKRRYFEIYQDSMQFYKEDTKSRVLNTLTLNRRVAGVREWEEGFEELRAISHSFALTFRDDEPPWLFYADSEGEKENLVGLLSSITGP